jgi:CHAD domain-containing protein
VARARAIPELQPDGPFAAAAADVVAIRADELREHSHDVLDLDQIERVHDLRVASRRLRAVLEVFRPCFPKRKYKAAVAELTALADALGERRDRDVQLEALRAFAAELDDADRAGVEGLITAIAAERPLANAALAPSVSEERMTALGNRLDDLVEAARAKGGRE